MQQSIKQKIQIVETDLEKRFQGLQQITEHLQNIIQSQDQRLKETEAQLIHAGKLALLGTHGASIAHELNNPLTAISAETEEILDAINAGAQDTHQLALSAKNIQKYANRMRTIIDHICDYARDEGHGQWEQIDINDVIQDSLLLFQTQLRNSKIKLHLFLSDNLPNIWGQRSKLESVFQNLIVNAIQAFRTLDDARQKKICISSDREGPDKIRVRIKDNANGIPEEIRENIFRSFFTTKEKGEGTGLGLSIAKSIVKKHHGDITFESESGHGTEFKISLPLERRSSSKNSPTKRTFSK